MRYALGALLLAACLLWPFGARAQEGNFLDEREAPAAVFPDADHFERQDVPVTPALREQMATRLGATQPSLWEERYVVFTASQGGRPLGRACIVEEIGKHRPITFVVGVRGDGTVSEVAVMSYREPYGGEVKSKRFLRQFEGKGPDAQLHAYHDIQNIAGATLSVEAAGRAVRKAQALAGALDQQGQS